jgi:hypothetical protein
VVKPSECWSVGDYSVVGDLWSSPGRDLAALSRRSDRLHQLVAQRPVRPDPSGHGPVLHRGATPWHESPDGIREIAGAQADVREMTLELHAASPEELVNQMERRSAPIVMAGQALGEQWPRARSALLHAVARAADGAVAEVGNHYRTQVAAVRRILEWR